MKTKIYFIALFLIPVIGFSQETDNDTKTENASETIISPTTTTSETSSGNDYGWNKRISFFVGAGISTIVNTVYELPVIDKTTNNVIIEESGSLKPNVSMGIVYTPFVYDVERRIQYRDTNGDLQTKYVTEHVPKHFSIALFINPISLASANSNLNNTVDLGFGLGWRSDSFSVFATMEFFGLQQPRNYFVNEFGSNDKQYIIGEEVQTSIDITDNSIFRTKVMTSFGIKIAYTFDIVNSYSNASNQ